MYFLSPVGILHALKLGLGKNLLDLYNLFSIARLGTRAKAIMALVDLYFREMGFFPGRHSVAQVSQTSYIIPISLRNISFSPADIGVTASNRK
jgi:hypothetical protein